MSIFQVDSRAPPQTHVDFDPDANFPKWAHLHTRHRCDQRVSTYGPDRQEDAMQEWVVENETWIDQARHACVVFG